MNYDLNKKSRKNSRAGAAKNIIAARGYFQQSVKSAPASHNNKTAVKPTAYIIHGIYGDPTENWFLWLRKELEALGFNVIIPHFPGDPPSLNLKSWLKIFERYQKIHDSKLTPDSIVIGHSLGVAFLLNILEEYAVRSAYFVAGVSGPLKNKFDEAMKTFSYRRFNFQKIRAHAQNFTVFHADNDPYIPLEKGEHLAKKLKAKFVLIQGGGHLNTPAGFKEFPELLGKIKEDFT